MFYFTRQQSSHFDYSAVQNNFVEIPGLSLTINNHAPSIAEIRFQGNLVVFGRGYRSYVRIMIDNKILIYNKLYPNHEGRRNMDPFFQNNLLYSDWHGGIYLATSANEIDTSYAKLETVLLPPGVHTISAVTRTDRRVVIHNAELFIKVTSINTFNNTNLPILQAVDG